MDLARPWLQHYAAGVPAGLDYPAGTLHELAAEAARRYANLPAIRFLHLRLTYAQLWERVERCAAALAGMGVRPGDRVALMMPNCPQYVAAYFGVLRTGAIVAQVNPLYTPRELDYVLRNSGARAIVVADALYPTVQATPAAATLSEVLVATLKGDVPLGPEAMSFEAALAAASGAPPAVSVTAEDVAVLQYTGGTTGVSKGAMLTHFNLVANATQVRAWNPRPDPPGEGRILTAIPLFHVYAMTVCLNAGILGGAELILLPRFDLQQVMETIRDSRPTQFPGVPTMYVAVNSFPNAEQYGVDSIRVCNSGAAPMPQEVMQAFEQRTGAQIVEGYGLSEASPVTHCNPIGGRRKAGTIGLPYPDTEAQVVDLESGTRVLPPGEPGELRLRGPQVMAGYWQMPEETAIALRDGWLYTGDIATMDEDGYFAIVDRKKDMIICSGYNVYPRDVEEVLYEHPAVREACVAGVPDPYRGETVKAYVVRRPGAQLEEAELIAYCRERMASFKAPTVVEFRDTLPKSAVGKILRRVLQEEDRTRASSA